jgi:hypothetical protein
MAVRRATGKRAIFAFTSGALMTIGGWSSTARAATPGDDLPDWHLPDTPITLAQFVNPADAQRDAGREAAEAKPREITEPAPTPREQELEHRVAELEKALGIQPQTRASVAPTDASAKPQAAEGFSTGSQPRLRSWELPPVQVVGEGSGSGLREEDRVGSYEQPRWTATRRFPGTRIYVIPEGKVEVEYGLRPTFDEGGDTEIRSLYEIEFGLPHRFQLDLYLRTDQDGDDSEQLLGSQVELRYALADWGKIWGNPTLYVEWASLEQRPDNVEFKLLLGDELAPRWHWGINVAAELQTSGEREYEYQFTGGLSYTVIDQVFSVGVELESFFADVKADRGDFSQVYYMGPSFQFRPMPAFTINFAPLAGFGPDAGDARIYLNLGYEF